MCLSSWKDTTGSIKCFIKWSGDQGHVLGGHPRGHPYHVASCRRLKWESDTLNHVIFWNTSEGILSNCNVDQRRVFKMESSLDGHQPSSRAQVHPVAPCLECSTSTRPSLPVSSELTWWLYCLRNGVPGTNSASGGSPRAGGATSKYPECLWAHQRGGGCGKQPFEIPIQQWQNNLPLVIYVWTGGSRSSFMCALAFCTWERWFVTTVCLLATGDCDLLG